MVERMGETKVETREYAQTTLIFNFALFFIFLSK